MSPIITVIESTPFTYLGLSLKNRVYPKITPKDEFDSLVSHSKYFEFSSNPLSKPTESEKDQILFIMENYYSSCRTEMHNWFTYESYLDVLNLLELTSSPGDGFSSQSPTIGGWLKFNGISFDSHRVLELWSKVQYIKYHDDLDSVWKVFIKREPHKVSKMENKRWRIIMACPLDLQVLWQMVFAKQNDREIKEALFLPSAQGFILPYGGWRNHYNKWIQNNLLFGSDKTAWDWTVNEWMIDLDLRFRQRITDANDDWRLQAAKLYKNAFYDTTVMLSNAQKYKQLNPGIMKSGCVNTISTNSHCQVMLHVLYSLRKGISVEPMLVAVGDDTLQDEAHAVDIELYESFGCKIKSVSETLEFLGREWNENGPRPMYTSKHVFALCTKDIDLTPEILDAYMREYVNAQEFEFWRLLAIELGFSSYVHSREYYKYWMDNPDARHCRKIMA